MIRLTRAVFCDECGCSSEVDDFYGDYLEKCYCSDCWHEKFHSDEDHARCDVCLQIRCKGIENFIQHPTHGFICEHCEGKWCLDVEKELRELE